MSIHYKEVSFPHASGIEFIDPESAGVHEDAHAGTITFRLVNGDGSVVPGLFYTFRKLILNGIYQYYPEDGSYIGLGHDSGIFATISTMIVGKRRFRFNEVTPMIPEKVYAPYFESLRKRAEANRRSKGVASSEPMELYNVAMFRQYFKDAREG